MAGEDKNTNTISKKNTGFPDYLDFEKLRRESIEYIGKLSGRIWTDHNVHDPGITILEVLCYALLDLGYRTHLPVEDILSGNPAETGKDNNFFTPAQILTVNPLTVTDYRKMLVDIKGVKNAWLTPADDQRDWCNQRTGYPGGDNPNNNNGVFLNGLYHVFIELEQYPDDGSDLNVFAQEVLKNVKAALMAHRNLCEDFVDVFILCRLQTGVCASVELEDNADAETVYITIAEKLNEFFSPAPKFYTLQQMLDKSISIEDIFAGRPYSPTSHGFTDTTELEAIPLRKEIHLSDVYNVLFTIPGVKKVTALQLRTCDADGNSKLHSGWKFNIPENYIPSFSPKCSGFEFTRNGLQVSVDMQKFETLFELNFTHIGRVPYPITSPYLDVPVPQGNYSDALDDYYSVQNDFPEVYGIGNGDLADDVPGSRKARALQLKGYLLFFDQLLANYLSQLSNIRSLFALSSPADKKDRHTYFLNHIETVPDMDKLLRFPPGDVSSIGAEGATLVFPVPTAQWDLLPAQTGNMQDYIASLQPYSSNNLDAARTATLILQNDLLTAEAYQITVLQAQDETWFYGILATSPDFVLLSKKTFSTQQEALHHASSVQYIGVHANNYRIYTTTTEDFSFDIEFNLTSYTEYLQLLEEDEQLYRNRRKDFLNHLLSRFAEKFTDFALLNWQDAQAIPAAENLLTHYDDLSRNRGRGYNYNTNGWNTQNSSGFEKKVKALAGLPGDEPTLCHFVVEPCEDYYNVHIRAGKDVLLSSVEKFDSQPEAESAAASIITAMKQTTNYRAEYIGHEKHYELRLYYGRTVPAVYPHTFENSNHAEQLAGYLVRSFNNKPDEHDVAVNDYVWRADLLNHKNELLAYSVDVREQATEMRKLFPALAKKINDPKVWTPVAKGALPVLKVPKKQGEEVTLINTAAFKLNINDTIVGLPGKFTYGLLDQDHHFKIAPNTEFDNAKAAGDHSFAILAAAADRNNWRTVQDEQTGEYTIQITHNDIPEASFVTKYKAAEEAEEEINKAHLRVREHCYTIHESKHPKTWKFYYTLGYEENDTWRFESEANYTSHETAEKALEEFYRAIPQLTATVREKDIILEAAKNKKLPAMRLSRASAQPTIAANTVTRIVSQQQEIRQTIDKVDEQKLAEFVQPDRVTEQPGFLYRVVNKNRIPARTLSSFTAKDIPAQFKRKIATEYKQQQWAPMICLGGDIVISRTDEQGVTRYHYEIRFRNLPFVNDFELSLFTSVMGYDTAEDAEKAFNQHYLHILHYASDKDAYGKYISLEPVYLPQPGKNLQTEALVFITEAAAKIFKTKFGSAGWLPEIARISAAYPVKIIRYGSEAFSKLFCLPKTDEATGCGSHATIAWKYYFDFSLYKPLSDIPDPQWVSTHYFDTPGEALEEFKYFNRLLGYTGNWFIDCDTCGITNEAVFRFFIYEVLAESVDCFPSREAAWGKYGVEAFICAIQTGKSVQRYARKTDCCYSFYINCGDSLVQHPCNYDTPEKRNKAMDELYNRYKQLSDVQAFEINPEGDSINISNIKGKPIARIPVSKDQYNDLCDILADAVMAIQSPNSKWEHRNGVFILINNSGIDVLESHRQMEKITIATWKEMLEQWACFFPVTRTLNGTTKADATGALINTYNYCIEIKIPGFSSCGPDELPDEPCTCATPETASEPWCYIAWKSSCCFSTCAEVMRAMAQVSRLLKDFRNYHSVFDCTCGNYGIALHTEVLPGTSLPGGEIKVDVKDNIPGVRTGELVNIVNASTPTGQIIARNPQCYQTPEEVCAAADQLQRLVNAAGLHLVEHILLRPYCYEDCQCYDRMKYCYVYENCNYPPYTTDSDDPCVTTPDIPFTPGTDPYSFIATVVLPAWPSVFRDESKRKQAEYILYSEAPAHVLLRILWLRPMDFCRFEAYHKEWKKQMAGMSSCNNNFSGCDFLRLVFYESYNCLPECTVCLPCTNPGTATQNSCTDQRKKQLKDLAVAGTVNGSDSDFLNLVNDVFCLGEYYCGDQRIIVVEDKIKEQPVVAPGIPVKESVPATETPAAITPAAIAEKTAPAIKEKKAAPVKPVKETAKTEAPEKMVPPVTAAKPVDEKKPAIINLKEKAHFVNSRHKRYVNLAMGVLEHSKENPLAIKTRVFVQSATPDAAKLTLLVKEIIQNKKPAEKGVKTLNKNQTLDLVQASVCHYLDKISFNGKDAANFNALKPAMDILKKAKIDMQAVHNYWDAAGISVYEPDLDTGLVKKLFSGAKK